MRVIIKVITFLTINIYLAFGKLEWTGDYRISELDSSPKCN